GHELVGDTDLPRRFQSERLGLFPDRTEQLAERGRLRRRPRAAGRGLLQICADREWRLGLPDDEPHVIALGLVQRLLHAVQHVVADGMHAALEADDRDVVAGVPAAHTVGLEYGFAVLDRLAQQAVGERLAAVNR